MRRCPWCGTDDDYIAYHDDEWGRPVYDDRKLFEMLILEGAQAGLSWLTILKRRAGYREVFDQFDYQKIAAYSDEALLNKLQDKRIIRNRLKVFAVRSNAQAYLSVIAEHGTFADYLWSFVDGRPIVNAYDSMADVPAETPISRALSQSLKRYGFKFVGPTICYAYMQAVGLVNDHLTTCDFRDIAQTPKRVERE